MRLYKRHDLDLLCLYKTKGFSMSKAIKAALSAYITRTNKVIEYPRCEVKLEDLPSTIQFHLYLSPEKPDEADIINCIANIPVGYKNSFVKNLTRYYLQKPALFRCAERDIIIDKEGQ